MESKENRARLRKVCSCVLFLALICYFYVEVTYLFRETSYDRVHIVGIKKEENLDMVYIGGSNVFVYWQPLRAWNDCGFTSYNYATNSMLAEMTKYYVQEVLKMQTPELFVIDVRSFVTWKEDSFYETGLRNGSDSMNFFSTNRLQMINAYMESSSYTGAKMPYYFDIIKYHSNYANVLGNPVNWQYRSNDMKSDNKGWEWQTAYNVLETPRDFQTIECTELEDGSRKLLIDLLDFCNNENLQVLFVVCPYSITKEDQMKYNYAKGIIEEYGFDFLNTNEHYEEMGLDFTRDFYNGNHVNCFGAEKYTQFLEQYIVKEYGLPDHRSEAKYSDWYREYARFEIEEAIVKENTEELILNMSNFNFQEEE